MGSERGFIVDYATGWYMDDEDQTDEVERRVRDEEPVVVDLFSDVPGFQHVDRADVGHGIIGRGQLPEPRGAMCKTPQILLQDVRDAAECRTAVLA